jgi:hypothetical protein
MLSEFPADPPLPALLPPVVAAKPHILQALELLWQTSRVALVQAVAADVPGAIVAAAAAAGAHSARDLPWPVRAGGGKIGRKFCLAGDQINSGGGWAWHAKTTTEALSPWELDRPGLVGQPNQHN